MGGLRSPRFVARVLQRLVAGVSVGGKQHPPHIAQGPCTSPRFDSTYTHTQLYCPPSIPARRFAAVCPISGKPMKDPTMHALACESNRCGKCLCLL